MCFIALQVMMVLQRALTLMIPPSSLAQASAAHQLLPLQPTRWLLCWLRFHQVGFALTMHKQISPVAYACRASHLGMLCL
jgi:hypothetical protein